MGEYEIIWPVVYPIFAYIFNFIYIAYYTRHGVLNQSNSEDIIMIAGMMFLFSPISIILTLYYVLSSFFAWLFPK